MTKENQNPNLKHNKIINEKRLVFGVPSNIFFAASALVLISWVTAGFPVAITFFLIFIPPLIIIHKDDEQALTILLDNLTRPSFYSAGETNDKPLKILSRKSQGTFEVKKISEIQ